jgi:hypothetical protein
MALVRRAGARSITRDCQSLAQEDRLEAGQMAAACWLERYRQAAQWARHALLDEQLAAFCDDAGIPSAMIRHNGGPTWTGAS